MILEKQQAGFTLIELMITVAIIGVLASIAIPAYNTYTVDSANNSCLSEAKSYTNSAYASIVIGESAPATPTNSACDWSGTTLPTETSGQLQPTTRSPGDATITCSMETVNCSL